jgi:hypothetical protein
MDRQGRFAPARAGPSTINHQPSTEEGSSCPDDEQESMDTQTPNPYAGSWELSQRPSVSPLQLPSARSKPVMIVARTPA